MGIKMKKKSRRTVATTRSPKVPTADLPAATIEVGNAKFEEMVVKWRDREVSSADVERVFVFEVPMSTDKPRGFTTAILHSDADAGIHRA